MACIDTCVCSSTNEVAAKQTGALKENVIEITLTCHAPSAKTMESQKKKVPVNMTLGTLRTLIEKLFTLPKSKMKLFLQLDHQTFPEDITDVKDDRRLGDLYIVVSAPSLLRNAQALILASLGRSRNSHQ